MNVLAVVLRSTTRGQVKVARIEGDLGLLGASRRTGRGRRLLLQRSAELDGQGEVAPVRGTEGLLSLLSDVGDRGGRFLIVRDEVDGTTLRWTRRSLEFTRIVRFVQERIHGGSLKRTSTLSRLRGTVERVIRVLPNDRQRISSRARASA